MLKFKEIYLHFKFKFFKLIQFNSIVNSIKMLTFKEINFNYLIFIIQFNSIQFQTQLKCKNLKKLILIFNLNFSS